MLRECRCAPASRWRDGRSSSSSATGSSDGRNAAFIPRAARAAGKLLDQGTRRRQTEAAPENPALASPVLRPDVFSRSDVPPLLGIVSTGCPAGSLAHAAGPARNTRGDGRTRPAPAVRRRRARSSTHRAFSAAGSGPRPPLSACNGRRSRPPAGAADDLRRPPRHDAYSVGPEAGCPSISQPARLEAAVRVETETDPMPQSFGKCL